MSFIIISLVSISALLIAYIIFRLQISKVSAIPKFFCCGGLSMVLLWLINIATASLSFAVGVNYITVLLCGFLGLPGVALIIGVNLLI
jgi:inhibitor of the pro-sigma K processing machinery